MTGAREKVDESEGGKIENEFQVHREATPGRRRKASEREIWSQFEVNPRAEINLNIHGLAAAAAAKINATSFIK
jgi:hypothetical protein